MRQRACEHVLACNRFCVVVLCVDARSHDQAPKGLVFLPISAVPHYLTRTIPLAYPQSFYEAEAIVLASAFNKHQYLLVRQHSVQSQSPGRIQPARTPFALSYPSTARSAARICTSTAPRRCCESVM